MLHLFFDNIDKVLDSRKRDRIGYIICPVLIYDFECWQATKGGEGEGLVCGKRLKSRAKQQQLDAIDGDFRIFYGRNKRLTRYRRGATKQDKG